jgi:hypothetical protein
MHAQAFVFQQHFDVGESLHTLAQDLINRRLIQELLWRMPCASRRDLQIDERHTGGVDEVQRTVGQHVLL